MAGAGFSRAGLDPAGMRSNDASPIVRMNNASLCRAIDPARHDYVRPTTGEGGGFVSQSITSAKVLMALGNKVGSFSGSPEEGDPSLSIDRDDGRLPERALAYARAQLQPLIDAGEVELIRVDVEVGNGAWARTVVWVDVSTGQQHRTTT